MNEILAAWGAVLENFVWTEVEMEDVMPEVSRLMAHGLASYDAVHAATAIWAGNGRLVTIDAGFASVPEADLELYVDSSRLGSCRSRRS
jgi:predicted nucleic acid-binding protein